MILSRKKRLIQEKNYENITLHVAGSGPASVCCVANFGQDMWQV